MGTKNEKRPNRDLASLHKTKIKQMTPVVHRHSHNGNFVTKRVFSLIYLYLHLIDNIGKQTFVGKKNFLNSFIHIIHFISLQICTWEVARKVVVMEPVFSMDRGFKVLLKSSIIDLTQSWCTNSGIARTRTLIHNEKSCVNHYTTGVAGGDAYIFWQKYTGGKHLKSSDYLNQF